MPRPLPLLVHRAAVELLELLLQAPQLLLQLLCSLAVLSFEVLQQPVQAAVQLVPEHTDTADLACAGSSAAGH